MSWARLSDAYPDSPPQAVCIDDQRCTDCAAHPVAPCEREPLLAMSAATTWYGNGRTDVTLTRVSPTDRDPVSQARWDAHLKAGASADDQALLGEETGRWVPRTSQSGLERPPHMRTRRQGDDPQNDTQPGKRCLRTDRL